MWCNIFKNYLSREQNGAFYTMLDSDYPYENKLKLCKDHFLPEIKESFEKRGLTYEVTLLYVANLKYYLEGKLINIPNGLYIKTNCTKPQVERLSRETVTGELPGLKKEDFHRYHHKKAPESYGFVVPIDKICDAIDLRLANNSNNNNIIQFTKR